MSEQFVNKSKIIYITINESCHATKGSAMNMLVRKFHQKPISMQDSTCSHANNSCVELLLPKYVR